MTWWKPKTWFSPKDVYRDTIAEERAVELLAGGLGIPTASGFLVNEQTAMRVSTVYRCVSLISGTIASLPCEIYRRKDDKRAELAPDHPAFMLLHDSPSALMTANTFWKNFIWSACMRGNGFGVIGRSALGVPKSLSWVQPQVVSPELSQDGTRLVYTIRLPRGEMYRFDQDDVLHYPFIGWDGLQGRAPLECARDAVGLAAAAQEFNEQYFSHGSAADIKMEFPGPLQKEQVEHILKTYEKTRSGSRGQRYPLIAYGGGKVERIDFNAEDSQLLESRQFQVEDICRFFGVPPHMVGHTSKTTSWGSGIEQQTLGFVKFTLRDILKGIEQEVNRKILRSGKFYCKFNLDALLRADSKGRAEFYKAAIGGTQSPGFMTVNEVRQLENLPPLPGGDELYVPVSKTDAASTPEGAANAQ